MLLIPTASLGRTFTIDVAKNGDSFVPYIGYYALSSARPKFAYRASDTVQDGVINDAYTGNWEVTLIPTEKRAPQDTINVGVWKNASGEIKNSTTGTAERGTDWGKAYGNGTSNPILAYAIRESSTKGTIETAQKR